MADQYVIFVIDKGSETATNDEMEAIGAFNTQLRVDGEFVFAGGLADPKNSNVIDNRNGVGIETAKPHYVDPEHFSGFWIINAGSPERARVLAFEGSRACNRKVELRPLL